MSDVSVESRLSSPPLSPHGGAHAGRQNGIAVLEESDGLLLRHGAVAGPAADHVQGLENGTEHFVLNPHRDSFCWSLCPGVICSAAQLLHVCVEVGGKITL
jgi:hypothetical protein